MQTSTMVGGQTSFLAMVQVGASDINPNYVAERRLVRVSPEARIYEVVTAEDWHALIARHGVQNESSDTPHPSMSVGRPWGPNDLLVPDWSSIAQEWDGVHITLWAVLTATQVRIESEAGATETFLWEGEQTIWTRWAFDDVTEMEPYDFREVGRHVMYAPWPAELGKRFAEFPRPALSDSWVRILEGPS